MNARRVLSILIIVKPPVSVFVYLQAKPRLQREGSCASLHNSLMRNSIFQLMIHTLDPLSDEGMWKTLTFFWIELDLVFLVSVNVYMIHY